MTLEDFYAFAGLSANIAVVASLLYVAVQLHQSTRAARVAAVQAAQAAIGGTEELIISDSGFAEILRRGLTAAPDELSDTDRIRLHVFYRHTLRAFQMAHYQFRQAVLDQAVWEPLGRNLAAIFQADRGMREHFSQERYMLDPNFAAFCDECLSQPERWTLTSADKPLTGGEPRDMEAGTS